MWSNEFPGIFNSPMTYLVFAGGLYSLSGIEQTRGVAGATFTGPAIA